MCLSSDSQISLNFGAAVSRCISYNYFGEIKVDTTETWENTEKKESNTRMGCETHGRYLYWEKEINVK